jgi:lysine 2,3-aminomutase
MDDTHRFVKTSSSVVSAEDEEPPDRSTVSDNDSEEPPSLYQTEILTIRHPEMPEYFGSDRTMSAKNRTKGKTKKTSCFNSRFRKQFYADITCNQWNDWRWQIQNRLTTQQDVMRILTLSDTENAAFRHSDKALPFAVTPYYASLINPMNPDDPIRRTMIPDYRETLTGTGESCDPLCEDASSPVPGLIHRYPDRVLFLVTNHCAAYCRYCTRSRIMDHADTHAASPIHRQAALDYIAQHSEIRDVVLSGGDPLTISDPMLEQLLGALRKIPHIEIIRIGTKAPVVLPQRITLRLVRMLKQYHPLYMSIHFTHPDELTPEVFKACSMLADAGIPLGSQTVLLAGVNDESEVMKRLMQGLLRFRVRPYYLYQCDPINGSEHFRTSIDKGLSIIRSLRGHTSGYAVPTYVIDAPAGGGKIPLLPQYAQGYSGDTLVLNNYMGNTYTYYDHARSISDMDDTHANPFSSHVQHAGVTTGTGRLPL